MQTEIMNVTGMTCGGCTSNVTRALQAIDGVRKVHVSLESGQASVQYDEGLTSPDNLQSAVKGAGYGLTVPGAGETHKAKGGCCS